MREPPRGVGGGKTLGRSRVDGTVRLSAARMDSRAGVRPYAGCAGVSSVWRPAASRTMSTRDRIPSFRYTRVSVASTVLTLMNRRPAISRLVAPSMTSAAT